MDKSIEQIRFEASEIALRNEMERNPIKCSQCNMWAWGGDMSYQIYHCNLCGTKRAKQPTRGVITTIASERGITWDNAKAWEEKANDKKEIFDEPRWSWDCNFKLDFDGSLLRVSSRFYPPHKNAGNWWEGNVTVNFLDTELLKKEFKCDTLDELKTEVEKFTKHYAGAIKSRLS